MAEIKKGSKVKLVNASEIVAAFGNNDRPNAYLESGSVYTVAEVKVHKWHTTVLLEEVPNKWFNHHHFV